MWLVIYVGDGQYPNIISGDVRHAALLVHLAYEVAQSQLTDPLPFLGFYYVCVDFNPPATQAGHPVSVPEDVPEGDSLMQTSAAAKPESSPRMRRESLNRGSRRNRSVSSTRSAAPAAATMSGFYFHQNSEP